jgi:hypothetical protein
MATVSRDKTRTVTMSERMFRCWTAVEPPVKAADHTTDRSAASAKVEVAAGRV